MARVTACSTLVYTESTLEEAVKRISLHGFERLEIASLASYCKHFTEKDADTDRIKKLFLRYNLIPIALNYSTNKNDGYRYKLNIEEEAQIVERKLIRTLNSAAVLGIPLVNIGAGQKNDTISRKDEMRKAAGIINRMAEYAKKLGMMLTLEAPHCWLLYNDLDRTQEMFSLITSDNVGVIMDSSHWGILKYDIDTYMSIVGNRLRHVHLRDAAGIDTGDFKQKLEITPGKGEVDFEKFGWYLDKYNYSGDVSIEFEYKNTDVNEVEVELAAGIKYLKKCGWEFSDRVK